MATRPNSPSAEPWDLIVIGGGIAGLTAANRAAERGKRVLLLEKGEPAHYPCNTRFSGGAFHIAMRDVFEPAATLEQAVLDATDGTADPALLETLIHRAVPTLRWLQGRGIRFGRVPAINQQNVLLPLRPNRPGVHWPGRGGDVLARTLAMQLIDRGGTLLRGHKALQLLQRNGAICGVMAENTSLTTSREPIALHAHAVLLADGGFQANPTLLTQTGNGHPANLHQRNAGSGTGDGLTMALQAGAATCGLDHGFYGHVLSRDALHNDTLWPFPILDFLAMTGIVVNTQGERFADETEGGVSLANAIARLPSHERAWVIFDEPAWRTAGAHRAIPPNPHLLSAGGSLISAPNLEALAQAIHLPAQALSATIEQVQQATQAHTAHRLNPPRQHPPLQPSALNTPPWHAIPAIAGITYTMGGITIDVRARVLNPQGQAIPGIYAAGATTGGLDGGPRSGYVGGLMKSAVFGWIAGNEA